MTDFIISSVPYDGLNPLKSNIYDMMHKRKDQGAKVYLIDQCPPNSRYPVDGIIPFNLDSRINEIAEDPDLKNDKTRDFPILEFAKENGFDVQNVLFITDDFRQERYLRSLGIKHVLERRSMIWDPSWEHFEEKVDKELACIRKQAATL